MAENNGIDRTQYNARIAPDLKLQVKQDAVASRLTIDLITEVMIRQFFNRPQKERFELYKEYKAAAEQKKAATAPEPVAA